MVIDKNSKSFFNKYFQTFKDNAPAKFVEYSGYHVRNDFTAPKSMASSLEGLIVFYNHIEDHNANILDAGAGVCSWMLRSAFKNVTSIDPDIEYLNTVKDICKIENIDTNNFVGTLDDTKDIYDYTYYDYGNSERVPNLIKTIEKTKKLIYIDDTDDRSECSPFRNYVYNLANQNNYKIKDCRDAKDEFGRWGVIIDLENK